MNHQQVSKIIDFFRINRAYHSPYTFILDGNFLVQLLQKSLELQDKLKPVIPGKYSVKVTKCTLEELDLLGDDFKIVYENAKKMKLIKCEHTSQSVDRCILDHAEKGESVIICTQDMMLRRKLRGRSIPIMYFGPDQRITMEDIEKHIMANARQQEKEKLLPQGKQISEINQYREQQKLMHKLKEKNQQRKMASQRGVELKYIKKNVAKGPNPLSIKKKKSKEMHENNSDEAMPEKKKRIRKRKNRERGERSQRSQRERGEEAN